jgi:hypothetical protein
MTSSGPDDSPSNLGGPIESWKAIAAFFSVSVRTVQKWEQELGLPVHRMPGAKGRVYAYAAELRDWKAGQRTELPIALGPDLPEEPEEAAIDPSTKLLRWAVLVVVLAVLSAAAWWFTQRRGGVPVDYRVEGPILSAINGDGREVWRYTLPGVPWMPPRTASLMGFHPTFMDIEGDGHVELLFPFRTMQESSENDDLLCIDDRGRLKWKFTAGRPVATPGKSHADSFKISGVYPVQLGRGKAGGLLVLSPQFEYPFQVALLSNEGKLLREYWHSGHLNFATIADLDGDGKDEIFLSGVSNGPRLATLVQLDPLTMEGASRESNPDYQILNLPPPREVARILFPRTRVCRNLLNYNMAMQVKAEKTTITVPVAEVPAVNRSPIVYYILDHQLRLLDASPDDMFSLAAKAITGKFDPLTPADIAELRHLIYLTPPPGFEAAR